MNSKWHSIKAKYLLIKQSHPSSDLDGVVTAFRDGEVVLRSERRTEGFTEATEFIGYQGVKKGELVVHSMDAFAGAIGISKSDGRMSPVVHIYRGVDGVDLRYYAYYLKHLSNVGYIQSLSKGIRERSTSFDPAVLKELVLPVPPIEEQRRIANFLS
jgi:type I restriction enzyme S subunit